MNNSKRLIAMITLFLGFMVLMNLQVKAARLDDDNEDNQGRQIYVDDDHVQCPFAQYSSIQAAVLAAKPGDTINVCPGTYNEQVRIDKSLTVRGFSVNNQNQAIIKPNPALPNSTSLASNNPIAAIVLVDKTKKVTLFNLTIDGSTSGINACAPNLVGVYYRNSSGLISNLAVRNIKLGTGLEGCQSGLGIFVQSGKGGSSKVDVLNNSVHDYQKNGITANGVGTIANISGNAVSGLGATPFIAQNGIQVGFGASAAVDANAVINHIYSLCTSVNNCVASSANILVFLSDSVRITNNTTGKAQVNIDFESNKGEVSNNFIFETNIFDGIYLLGDENHATGNRIFNSQEAGIYVQGNKNEVNGNTINEAPVGIFENQPSSNNEYEGNRFFNTAMNQFPVPTTQEKEAGINNQSRVNSQFGKHSQPIQP